MYPLVFSENKPSAWLEASRTQWLCVFSCWVKLRFRGELLFLVGAMYDPAIHLTDKQFKEKCGEEVEVQKITEKAELYIVARY